MMDGLFSIKLKQVGFLPLLVHYLPLLVCITLPVDKKKSEAIKSSANVESLKFGMKCMFAFFEGCIFMYVFGLFILHNVSIHICSTVMVLVIISNLTFISYSIYLVPSIFPYS